MCEYGTVEVNIVTFFFFKASCTNIWLRTTTLTTKPLHSRDQAVVELETWVVSLHFEGDMSHNMSDCQFLVFKDLQ